MDVILVGLHLRWRGVWQRPNHLLARAARETPVIVLEEPLVDGDAGETTFRDGGVTVVTPHRTAASTEPVDAAALSAVRALVAGRRALVWLYSPMMSALADAFPHAPLAYDKMDELAQFAHADPRIAAREADLLRRADVVFAGGRSLYRSVAGRCRRAYCYPSGVDVEHFARAHTCAPHPALAAFDGRPVLAYIGVIDERIDLALVDELARAYPAATVAMIGPVVKVDPATLPRRPNIVYLGKREYDELPTLLARTDVALMPFALNRHTDKISPTKTLEYLAAGRPVVATAVPDVVADFSDVVHVARDRADFVRLVAEARAPDDERARRAADKIRSGSWDAIWSSMRDDLAQAGILLPETSREKAGFLLS